MAPQETNRTENAKYIKLGVQGAYESHCIRNGELRVAFYEMPHEIALSGDRESIAKVYLDRNIDGRTASGYARQLLDFYGAGPETIWVTFSGGYMWWCRAEKDVLFLGQDERQHPIGSRYKKTISAWQNKSLAGDSLLMSNLSGHLTKVSAYRQTICDISGNAFDYLIRKIEGRSLPEVVRAQIARSDLERAASTLIQMLTWRDFESLVDIIFSQNGWQRISEVGGKQKTIDIEFVNPLTNERAIVQVKSQTDQSQLDDYLEGLSAFGADRAYYAYHSTKQPLDKGKSNIELMDVEKLADCAIRAGLIDWLIDKTK